VEAQVRVLDIPQRGRPAYLRNQTTVSEARLQKGAGPLFFVGELEEWPGDLGKCTRP
jgi:hypothetical protein